ncbi:MAG: hypothetical protein U5Q03_19205 [Bacteroidota bacterium]|nr:hypothetical protein [Bacteroidota bacterium]
MDSLFVKTLLDVLHVIATVIWIGGMMINYMVIRPVAVKKLEPSSFASFNTAMMKRFRILVYISIVILGVTGIPMKIVSEHYAGIISFEHAWGTASFIKHLLYGLLVVLAVFNFEIATPALSKAAIMGNQIRIGRWKKRMAISGALAMLAAIGTLVLSSLMRYL